MRKKTLVFIIIIIFTSLFANIEDNDSFQLNEYTVGNQCRPSIATLDDAKYVVCWESDYQDGSENGIFAQIFLNNGVKIGGEFQVNRYTESYQSFSNVSSIAEDRFAITWASYEQDGSQEGVFAQIFNNNGIKIGEEFQVNNHVDKTQYYSSILRLSDGKFIIIWMSWMQNIQWDIYAKVYDINGEIIKDEFQINTTDMYRQKYPSTANLTDTSFVVCWMTNIQDGNTYDIVGQIFNHNCEKLGEEFQVNTTVENDQIYPCISLISENKFAVCWDSETKAGREKGIYCQIFNLSGEKLGEEIIVNTEGTYGRSKPAISNIDEEKFIICWTNGDEYINPNGITAKIFNSNGEKVYDKFQVNPENVSSQIYSCTSYIDEEKFIICHDSYDGSGSGIFSKNFIRTSNDNYLTEFYVISPQIDETVYHNTPIFNWQSSLSVKYNNPDDMRYNLYISKNEIFSNPRIYKNLSGIQYQLEDTLETSQSYYWKVMAINNNTDTLWSSNINGFFIHPDTSIYCQIDTAECLSYFPLNIGNKWQYKIISEYYYPDSIRYRTVEVLSDTLMPNGKLYKKMQGFQNDYIRIDSTSLMVYGFDVYSNENTENIIYNLSGLFRDTIYGEFEIEMYDYSVQHRWLKCKNVVGTFGDSTDCLWYQPSETIDLSICFSKGFGISYEFWQENMTFYHYLIGAEINGEKYGDFVGIENIIQNPMEYKLLKNYPNPFNSQTTISYIIPEKSIVQIKIFDIKGNLIETIKNKHNESGQYNVFWNPQNIASGVYIINFETNNISLSQRILYLK